MELKFQRKRLNELQGTKILGGVEKAAEEYMNKKITISRAAEKAGATVWEMEQYLVSKGFKSQYSTEDLRDEMNKIKAK